MLSNLRYFLPLTLALCAPAQTVEGIVINSVTSAGIGSVKVTLQRGQTSAYSATTDAAGHFLVEGVKDGDYSIRYEAERYFSPSRRNAPLRVGTGASPLPIVGRLLPLARISGLVTDPGGRVVPDAVVELTTLQNFWTARTDDKGRFTLDSVMPNMGDYTLQVEPPPAMKPPDPAGRPRAWAPTFYPGVSRRDQSSPLALAPGSDLQGLKIKLLAVPTHSVRGVLLKRDRSALPNVALALWETGPRRRTAYQAESNARGEFEFTAVADGEWRLHAEWKDHGVTLLADEWIEVRDRDMDSVKLRLAAPLAVNGQMILETPEGVPTPPAPGVLLIKRHAGQILFADQAIFTAKPGAGGQFRFEGLYPGSYVLQPDGPPPPAFYLDSIEQGATPAWDGVEISEGAPELAIVYKTHGGNVGGAVEKCDSGQVLLVRQDRPRGALVADCDASGRFQFSAVRPGEYYVVAVSDWPRPIDASLFQGATRATVRAGETTQLNLSLR